MSKKTKIWLIAAAILIVLGGALFTVSLSACDWDVSPGYETNIHTPGESFRDIKIDTDTADILFKPSEDGSCRVVCYEAPKQKHTVSVRDGILAIRSVDEREWYEHLEFSFRSPVVTVYLPEGEYGTLTICADTSDMDIPEHFRFTSIAITATTGDITSRASASGNISITTSTGDIRMEQITADQLTLTATTGDITVRSTHCGDDVTVGVSTGRVELADLTCKSLSSTGNTGDIDLRRVTASVLLSIVRTTGDVTFESCDAPELSVNTDTGDVTGSLLSEKVFLIETSTGDVRVPQSASGGLCRISTTTGDVELRLSE